MLRPLHPAQHSTAHHTTVQKRSWLLATEQGMYMASHLHGSASPGPRTHRLPTDSGSHYPQLPVPRALLFVKSSQQTISAYRRASACAAQLVLSTRTGACTKLYVRQPLWAVRLSLWKAQLCTEYSIITQGKSSTGCERHQLMHEMH